MFDMKILLLTINLIKLSIIRPPHLIHLVRSRMVTKHGLECVPSRELHHTN